ncbi:FRG domain-containing protein [Variovorax sp. YR634]|uniref:FRG domain-containing protein n=1 Tax=unclassified Variovorax TaxID=663243 RepID=UPI000897D2AC|nr:MULTISPECIES: FRG domain-containing protein [unclassified Variovorax]SDW48472.1 FRG domain-containing protein [Variovorax sp. YR634]SOD29473.1 FRG domain-containing protein [Variovorax sp. YR752]
MNTRSLVPSPMQEIRVRSWAEFVDHCDRRDGWAFRGQADPGWALFSSLSRRLLRDSLSRQEWRLREERAIRIFRRKAHVYLPDRSVLQDELRCLALMQHHGAPTRLLDFTKSPFVAAFFAVEQAAGDAAVYALNTPWLWSAAPSHDATLTRDEIDPRVQGNFERYFADNRHPMVWFGEPSEMDRRLVAQSGLLVMPGTLEMPLDEVLRSYRSAQPLIEKVVLGRELRAEAMHALYRMNITQATLFPDLEGLARSIAYELEEIWQRPAPGSD